MPKGVTMILSHGDPVDRPLRFLDEGAVAVGVSGKGTTCTWSTPASAMLGRQR
ncbi:MAG: hypothetical protein ABWW70_02510 [Thermoproteota archaeon]